MQSWINIHGNGGENVVHNHPNCHMSAVYYVSTPKGCGRLRLYSPRRFPASMDNVNPDMVKEVALSRGSALPCPLGHFQNSTKMHLVIYPQASELQK